MIYPVKTIIDGIPTFEKPGNAILKEIVADMLTCKAGDFYEAKRKTALEYHTDQQRKWYKGIALAQMAEQTGYTEDECDYILKVNCAGEELLKREQIYMGEGKYVDRLTVKGVGKRKLTKFIENILAYAITNELLIMPPDRELRR